MEGRRRGRRGRGKEPEHYRDERLASLPGMN